MAGSGDMFAGEFADEFPGGDRVDDGMDRMEMEMGHGMDLDIPPPRFEPSDFEHEEELQEIEFAGAPALGTPEHPPADMASRRQIRKIRVDGKTYIADAYVVCLLLSLLCEICSVKLPFCFNST